MVGTRTEVERETGSGRIVMQSGVLGGQGREK
jgi:hypothetical protein